MTRTFSAILAVFLIAASSAAIALDTYFADNGGIERFLCGFLLCRNDLVIQSAQQELLRADAGAAQRSLPGFQEALRRNPASPYRWCDLGDAFLQAGETKKARYCFDRAIELGPKAPPILMRAGGYYFSAGDEAQALRLMAQVLDEIREYDGLIFSYYIQMETDFANVLRYGLPEKQEPAQSFFRYLLRLGEASHYEQAWEWIHSRSLADDRLVSGYIDVLLQDRKYELAAATWKDYVTDRERSKAESEFVSNRGFEHKLTGSALDWQTRESKHAWTERVSDQVLSGSWSLRIHFGGEENIAYHHLSQKIVVQPGRLRFSAYVRSQGITTDQGVSFRIFDSEDASRLDILTEPTLGTTEWRKIETAFTVPPETKLLELRAVRPTSRKFDNKIAGRLWIDDVSLVKE